MNQCKLALLTFQSCIQGLCISTSSQGSCVFKLTSRRKCKYAVLRLTMPRISANPGLTNSPWASHQWGVDYAFAVSLSKLEVKMQFIQTSSSVSNISLPLTHLLRVGIACVQQHDVIGDKASRALRSRVYCRVTPNDCNDCCPQWCCHELELFY